MLKTDNFGMLPGQIRHALQSIMSQWYHHERTNAGNQEMLLSKEIGRGQGRAPIFPTLDIGPCIPPTPLQSAPFVCVGQGRFSSLFNLPFHFHLIRVVFAVQDLVAGFV